MSDIGNDQVRSIIQRILRLKEEQDALSEDIREVYAEAKSNGFDKTALGQAVTAIRKREKDASAFEERETVVGLYLAAFYGNGTPVATRAHTSDPNSKSEGHSNPQVDIDRRETETGGPRPTTDGWAPAEESSEAYVRRMRDEWPDRQDHNEGGASQAAEIEEVRKLDAPMAGEDGPLPAAFAADASADALTDSLGHMIDDGPAFLARPLA